MFYRRRIFNALSAIILIGLVVSLVQPVQAGFSAAPRQDGLQPKVSYDLHHDLSPAMSDLAAEQKPAVPAFMIEQPMMPLPKVANAAPKAAVPDGALQNTPVSAQMPELITSFDGVNNIGGVAPPDTQGDIGYDPGTGKKYYMHWVNLHIQAWDVTDPAAPVALFTAPVAGNTIWAGFGGPCETSNDGDPIVLYDEIANRWMISQFAVDGPYYNCMAISQTSDPSGAYYRYAFLYSSTKMNDYPKFGVWPDGYYMTVNQFTNASTWGGAGVAVYERDQMLTGGTARQVIFDLESVSTVFGGMLPADFEGTPPPAGTPNYFAEVDDSSSALGVVDEMRLWKFTTDWAGNTFSFGLSGLPNQVLPVADFNLLCVTEGRDCVPQPNAQKLDGIGDRLMYRLAYRRLDDGSEHMVVNHTVDKGSSQAAVRWYELEKAGATWTIAHQGTYAGDTPATDTVNRWMGSIAMDRLGNLALGYSMSSAGVYPSLGIVGRLANDPANTLAQGERVAFSGAAAQEGVERWGDYSSMSLDPQDGCTFWFTTEYSTGGWNWATRIVAFKYPNCFAVPSGKISGTVRNAATSDPVAGAQVMAGIYGGVSAADGSYTIAAPTGTYNVSATAYAFEAASQTNVVVSVDTTTTVNFSLTPALMRQVSGVVSDGTSGGHAWPLYARLTLAGYPGGDIYTAPETGTYSVMLPDGETFGFTVNAMLPGYTPAAATVTVSASTTVQNFSLLADVESCQTPGYEIISGMVEHFDGVSAGSLPANWTSTKTSGTGSPAWSTNAGTRNPSGIAAVSAPNVAYFNAYSVSSGNNARLAYGLPLDMTEIATASLSFQMVHDSGYSSSKDTLQPVVSTDGGATWVAAGPSIERYAATSTWTKHIVDLSAYATATSLLMGFEGVSAYGNDIHIDDVTIGSPVCVKKAGGLLTGFVQDDNTNLPLNGAGISFGSGSLVTSQTSADSTLGDGFYYGFAPAGALSLTASKFNYENDTAAVSLSDGAILRQDFSLKAGLLSAAPSGFTVSIPMNNAATHSLTLANTGTVALNYEVLELNLAPHTAAYNPLHAPAVRHLGPKNFNRYSLEGVVYYLFPERSTAVFANAAAGTILATYTSGLVKPWGVGVDQVTGNIWIGNILNGGGDDLDHEFTPAGTATGQTMDTASWVEVFAADMAYDPLAGTLWQVNVGGDNCIYEMSPATLAPTGNKICPSFGTSERGLAYDPASDTFFAGSWNDSLIRRFNRDGVILEQVNVALPIAGLAYNPATGHLFVTNNGTSVASEITVLDVNNNYANLGGFDVAALENGESGLEFACDGHLWTVNSTNGNIYELDSGETGVCDYQSIPWLSETPVSGTIAVSGSDTVSLSFNTTGILPGVYQAQLKLLNDTPYAVANLPVSLTVTTPPNYGTVEGLATGLGVCDAAPDAALKGATVEVRNSTHTLVATLTTAADGSYKWTDRINDNDYTLTFQKAGYITTTETVTLVNEAVITHSVALRPDAPCLSITPASLQQVLQPGGVATQTFTLANSGAASATFEIVEKMAGGSRVQAVLLSENFEAATFPPSGWTVQSLNAETWKTTTNDAHSGSLAADVEYDAALNDQNEWLLTPEYALVSGSLSVWSKGSINWCRDTHDNCDANVWLVVGDVGGSDDVLLGKLDTAWTGNWDAWVQSTFNLTSSLTGSMVRIGFQYVGNDGAEVLIDDVLLDGNELTDLPWLSESVASGTLSADSGSTTINVTFDAAGLVSGPYTARIRTSDQTGRLVDLPVTLTVDVPTAAAADAYTAEANTPLTVDTLTGVLANDVDTDSVSLAAALVTNVQHGTLTLAPNGSFVYTPAFGYVGVDTFTYKVNDGHFDSNVVTVTLTVIYGPYKSSFLPGIFNQ